MREDATSPRRISLRIKRLLGFALVWSFLLCCIFGLLYLRPWSRHNDVVDANNSYRSFFGGLSYDSLSSASLAVVVPSNAPEKTDEPTPLLFGRSYSQTPGLTEWQEQEKAKEYASSDAEHMHGILDISSLNFTERFYKIPLDRSIPETRSPECLLQSWELSDGAPLPPATVVMIFNNEHLDLLMRSVHSILNRTPPHLLREILLVDDFSDVPEIAPIEVGGAGKLQEHIALLPKVRYIRLPQRGGIVVARTAGIEAALTDIFVVLDSHIEVQHGWLEPLIKRVAEAPTTMVMPHIDGISAGGTKVLPGGIGCHLGIIWQLIEHAFNPPPGSRHANLPVTAYKESPTMAGGLFAGNKNFFKDVGGYDTGMTYWGTENLELSFRLWQCGGRLECNECSRVHHLFGGNKRWSGGAPHQGNKLRTMAVWMDEYADLVYHVLGEPPLLGLGDLESRLQLRRDLRCHSWRWFVQNVWPESAVHSVLDDVPYYGALKHKRTGFCFGSSGSVRQGACYVKFMFFKRTGKILLGHDDERGLRRSASSWVIDIAEQEGSNKFRVIPTKTDGILISFEKEPSMCLTVDSEKGSLDFLGRTFTSERTTANLTLIRCDPEDEMQIWNWPRYEFRFRDALRKVNPKLVYTD